MRQIVERICQETQTVSPLRSHCTHVPKLPPLSCSVREVREVCGEAYMLIDSSTVTSQSPHLAWRCSEKVWLTETLHLIENCDVHMFIYACGCFFFSIDPSVVPLKTLLLSLVLKADSSQLPAHQWWNARCWSLSFQSCVAGRRGRPHFQSVGFIWLHYSQAGPLSTEKWNLSLLLGCCFFFQ